MLELPGELRAPEVVALFSSAVAPPKRMSLGPIYPGDPSSPTAATAVNVWPHRGPGLSSFFSMIVLTGKYVGTSPGLMGDWCGDRRGIDVEVR